VQPRSAWTLSEITPETAKPAPSVAHIGARHAGTAVLMPDPDAQPAEPLDRSRREPRSVIDGAQHAISAPISLHPPPSFSRAYEHLPTSGLLHCLGIRRRYQTHVFAYRSDRNYARRCAFRSRALSHQTRATDRSSSSFEMSLVRSRRCFRATKRVYMHACPGRSTMGASREPPAVPNSRSRKQLPKRISSPVLGICAACVGGPSFVPLSQLFAHL
jgi:hypothetical protein